MLFFYISFYFTEIFRPPYHPVSIVPINMDLTTIATYLFNSTIMMNETTIAPTTMIAKTTTAFTSPFLVTSMSHKTLHSLTKASINSRHHIKDFSPVTLSTEWSSMARLLVLACLSVIGSIGNVFMISSVMIEDHLKKAGKQYKILFKRSKQNYFSNKFSSFVLLLNFIELLSQSLRSFIDFF